MPTSPYSRTASSSPSLDTEEANVLSLTDITHIGGTGLDLVEKLQDKLKAEAQVPAPVLRSEESDPLAGLKELPLDRAVTQIGLFEPRNRGSSHYHFIPLSSIAAWSDMRGEDADPLFLYDRQYLSERQI
jgi:hypothetical protein